MTMLYGFRRGARGNIEYRRFDRKDFPPGWFDSPEKLIASEAPKEKPIPEKRRRKQQ